MTERALHSSPSPETSPSPSLPRRAPFEIPFVSLETLRSKFEELGIAEKPVVVQALAQAHESHKDQERDDGGPYLEQHIYPVTLSAINHELRVGHRVEAKAVAAWLTHDVPEDDEEMPLPVFREEFGKSATAVIKPGRSVADLVTPLTKLPVDQFPGETAAERRAARDAAYYEGLEHAQYETLIGKLADRECNILSLHLCPLEKIVRKIRETEEHYLPMAERVSPYYYNSISTRIAELKSWLKEIGQAPAEWDK